MTFKTALTQGITLIVFSIHDMQVFVSADGNVAMTPA
jgi:hypothetical protein